ncbi:hypothetical protein H4W33_005321 [Kibdelosporangium phytohabitans]|nr:hypothetical protein [Kibdelosporangium phytohabitans]
MTADAQLAAADADGVLANPGGIRADLTFASSNANEATESSPMARPSRCSRSET